MDGLDETSAAADAADTGSGADASEGQRHDGRDARHDDVSLDDSPAGGDEDDEQPSAGASSEQDRVRQPATAGAPSPDAAGEGADSRQHPEHQDDGGPGTGCQPSSAAGDDAAPPAASPAAPDHDNGLTANERKILRAILALQTDGAFVTYRTIAERSGVQQDALSHYTKSLEQKGWLRRDGPVSDRRYHVLRNPDGGSANHTVAQHAWNGHAHNERDHAQARARSRESDGAVCSACKSNPASEGDLCTSCAGVVTACPGVGDGALPHYDDHVRASMANDVKRRKSRKSRAGA